MPKPIRFAFLGGAGTFAYALYEPFRYRLVEREVPVRWPGKPLRVLHLSDTHLTGSDQRLLRFLTELPERLPTTPDLVIATGDMIEGNEAITDAVDALNGIEARLGRFYVLGSHDYYISNGPSYTKYFSGDQSLRRMRHADTARLEEGLQEKGWMALTNRSSTLMVDGCRIRLSGIDDPYLKRHDTAHIGRAGNDDLAIGLVHAPDVVSEWALNGFDLVLAGHTHGGQVRFPGIGAVVTNCSLPSALAAGLHRVGETWLHVSPGLGTSRYTPIRFMTPPEATVLKLVPTV